MPTTTEIEMMLPTNVDAGAAREDLGSGVSLAETEPQLPPWRTLMKIANLVRYVDDADRVARVRPEHREYMDQLLDKGKLVAGGPYDDGSGALFIYQVTSLDEAEAIVASDPYSQQGVVLDHQLKSWTVVKADPGLLRDENTRVVWSKQS